MIFHGIAPRQQAWDIARRANADKPMPGNSREKYLAGEWDAAPNVQLLATGAELAFQAVERGES